MRTEETTINVIFDATKGETPVASREAVTGEALGALPTPRRTGYLFEGWYWNGNRVTEATTVESDCDIRLTAHWSRKKAAKRVSMLKRQRFAAVILSVVSLVLLITLFVVNHIVAIYGLTDVYYDNNGVQYTEKYTVKRQNGSYALFDKDGNRMESNEKGYFITHSGNQYIIDADTGEYELYARVDYDADIGEDASSTLVMMFPEIPRESIYSISVKNEYGTYRFYRDKLENDAEERFYIEGSEDSLVSYDLEKFINLCVDCGYTTAWKKLDLTSGKADIPMKDGAVDYSAYGLAKRYDAEGNLIYTPAEYTIIKAAYDEKGESIPSDTKYRVLVGDALLSGEGYYVQLVGRDAIYIINESIGDTVLQPIEALVTPQVLASMTTTSHVMVQNFMLGSIQNTGSLESLLEKLKDEDLDVIKLTAAFSFQSISSRQNTMLSTSPYVGEMGLLAGYELNDENVSTVLSLLHNLEFIACRKLVLTEEAWQEYGFDKDTFYLSVATPHLDSESNIDGYIDHTMMISQKTAEGTYYIASFDYGMIVEVDEYHLSFLEWEQKNWYNTHMVTQDLTYLREIHIQIGDREYDFSIDNSESDLSEYVNAKKIKIFCDQYLKGLDPAEPNLLDYSMIYTYVNNSGVEKNVTYTGLSNFKKFYQTLLWFSLEGDFDEEEQSYFEANLGMTPAEYIAQGDTACDAIIEISAEDYAATMNTSTYKDEYGNTVPLYPENNKIHYILRFYRYTERHALVTLEVVEEDKQESPTRATYAFYVLSSYLDEIVTAGDRLLAAEPVDPDSLEQ